MRVLFGSVLMSVAIATSGAVVPAAALGDELAVFAPVASKYTIGGFTYTAPSSDGWRQVTSSDRTFRLVYAESLGEGAINTRVEVVAEAFPIPDPALVTDVVALSQKSQSQQAAGYGERLIAFSRVAPVEAADGIQSFTLVSKLGEEELHETFFVYLAADKSEYFIAKLATKEPEFRNAPYFAPFEASLATLEHSSLQPKAAVN